MPQKNNRNCCDSLKKVAEETIQKTDKTRRK
jgi:hypothetical protein